MKGKPTPQKHDTKKKPGSEKRKRDAFLTKLARQAIRQMRRIPPNRARFSLYITSEADPKHRITVIDNGVGPDSAFWICYSPSGAMPEKAPPASTYVVRTAAELDSVIAWIAENPAMYSKPKGDALDRLETEPYDDDLHSPWTEESPEE
jgi:hypothetical protein